MAAANTREQTGTHATQASQFTWVPILSLTCTHARIAGQGRGPSTALERVLVRHIRNLLKQHAQLKATMGIPNTCKLTHLHVCRLCL